MRRGCRFKASGTPFIYGSCDFFTRTSIRSAHISIIKNLISEWRFFGMCRGCRFKASGTPFIQCQSLSGETISPATADAAATTGLAR